jgi:hypothetical protein
VVKESLSIIADDETRHAALAWRFVAWAAARDERARDALRAVFDGASAVRPAADPELPREDAARIFELGMRDVVLPCARAMLTAPEPARRAQPRLSAGPSRAPRRPAAEPTSRAMIGAAQRPPRQRGSSTVR